MKEHKNLTMRCAGLIRKRLKENGIKARVECVFYAHHKDLICVSPDLTFIPDIYWHRVFYKHGLEYFLNVWDVEGNASDLGVDYSPYCKVSVS